MTITHQYIIEKRSGDAWEVLDGTYPKLQPAKGIADELEASHGYECRVVRLTVDNGWIVHRTVVTGRGRRPSANPTTRMATIKMTAPQHAMFLLLGGSRWVKGLIDAAIQQK